MTPAILASYALLRGASPALLAELAASSHSKRYVAGDALWRAGDPATSFVLVRVGLVQIVRATVTLGLFGPRESIGDSAVIERAEYPADAVALSDVVEVVRVPAAVVLDQLTRDAGLAGSVQAALLDHTRALRAKIDVLSAGEVPARLATLLLFLAERFGDEHDGVVSVPVALSRGSLSRFVGARTETVIRVMTAWQRAGLVTTGDAGFEIARMSELAAIASSESVD
jgi:CRP-like cAMP-binding protein